MNNEKWKAHNNSFDSWSKNKRLTERKVWLTLKMGVSGVSGVSGVPHQREFPNQVCGTAKC